MARKNRKSKSQKKKDAQEQRAAARKASAAAKEQAAGAEQAVAETSAENLTQSNESAAGFARRMRKEKAAQLLARSELAIEEVAAIVGVRRETIWAWNQESEFAARVALLQQRIKEKLETLLISQRFYRQLSLQDQFLSLQRIKEARAEALDVPAEQGGESGLLVKRLRMIGSGVNATVVEEHVLDTGFTKEVRETLKQASQEAGQWVEKVAPTNPSGDDEYKGGDGGLGALALELRAAVERCRGRAGGEAGGGAGEAPAVEPPAGAADGSPEQPG